ncbi:MAG: zinc ABC transporter substrate-binding protein [Nitrospirae bacterium]|nr:zinc ABC transporter substrate-binding protein [Nitrospirota bacterium]
MITYVIILSVKTYSKLTVFLLLFLSSILLSCRQPDSRFEKYESLETNAKGSSADSKKLKVLTTIAPLYSFTKNITGDAADVENLLPSGTGPHEYSMSPEDVIKISQAQVLIKNGVGLETWLDKIFSQQLSDTSYSHGAKPLVADSSAGVTVIDNDPHIWLSPRNAIIQVKNIRDALIKADPRNGEIYSKNASAYIKRLEGLDREISESVRTFRRKEFVSFHSAFLYLARDYGLNQVAAIQNFPEREPTPKHMADVINIIKAKDIKVIFSEPRVTHKVVETIARDLKLQVYSLDTLETGALYPEWYEVRMRANLEVLKMVLNQ